MNVLEKMQVIVDEHFANTPDPEILEAGCGSGSYINMPEGSRVVGIDISEEELDKNEVVTQKIVGDIQTYEFEGNAYDLIVCWDVLEHVPSPNSALQRFVHAVKEGGIIVLAFPNVRSVKAVVAKYTPHSFHKIVYKRLYGENYGDPGLITFPTYLSWEIDPKRIKEFAEKNDMTVVFESVHESSVQKRFRKKYKISDGIAKAINVVVKIFTLGMLDFIKSDCIIILRKPNTGGASA